MISRLLRYLRTVGQHGGSGRPAGPGPSASARSYPLLPASGGPYERLLAGRTALVAGAGPNIGRGIAMELARAGADLVLLDRLEEPLHALRGDLAAFPVRLSTYVSDLTVPEQTDDLLARLMAEGVAVDVLVLNAGISAAIEDSPEGSPGFLAMDHIFRTNVVGPLYLAERVAQGMVAGKRSGSIIFVSSIHQWIPCGLPVYSASKAAVGMVVHELALKLAPHGVRVNAVAPGWVAADADNSPRAHLATPLRRTSVHPAFIGAAVVHLAAESLSGQTTGATITVDGGLSLHSYLTVPRS